MNITRIGLDLAKHVFQVHGVSSSGKTVLRKTLRREQVRSFFAQVEPCLIGMESCGGAHFWARELRALGHDVRLIAPQFVQPYRKSGKNDGNDAEVICEAVGRPNMRFVPIKDVEQQAVLTLHRARQLALGEPTALVNQLRGLLAEYGLVMAQGISQLRRQVPPSLRMVKMACHRSRAKSLRNCTSSSGASISDWPSMISESRAWCARCRRPSD